MQKIGFIGGYDKIDLMLYISKIITLAGKKVLLVDATQKQKSRYIVPTITPSQAYITEFESIDVAVGFRSIPQLQEYLESTTIPKQYDMIFIDVDHPKMFENFGLKNANINYFVTSFDVYDLKRGLEAVTYIQEPIKMTKVLFSIDMLKEEEDYLNFLAKDLNINWNTQFKIYFPITIGDIAAISENQRVEKIKFKKLSVAYKENLLFMVEDICKDIKSFELRKIMKNIEKGV